MKYFTLVSLATLFMSCTSSTENDTNNANTCTDTAAPMASHTTSSSSEHQHVAMDHEHAETASSEHHMSSAEHSMSSMVTSYSIHCESCSTTFTKANFHSVELHLHNTDQSNLEGATVTVKPWMPAHNHGSDETPCVQELGKGLYKVSGVYFTMSGTWDLQITITANGKTETIIKTVSVQ